MKKSNGKKQRKGLGSRLKSLFRRRGSDELEEHEDEASLQPPEASSSSSPLAADNLEAERSRPELRPAEDAAKKCGFSSSSSASGERPHVELEVALQVSREEFESRLPIFTLRYQNEMQFTRSRVDAEQRVVQHDRALDRAIARLEARHVASAEDHYYDLQGHSQLVAGGSSSPLFAVAWDLWWRVFEALDVTSVVRFSACSIHARCLASMYVDQVSLVQHGAPRPPVRRLRVSRQTRVVRLYDVEDVGAVLRFSSSGPSRVEHLVLRRCGGITARGLVGLSQILPKLRCLELPSGDAPEQQMYQALFPRTALRVRLRRGNHDNGPRLKQEEQDARVKSKTA